MTQIPNTTANMVSIGTDWALLGDESVGTGMVPIGTDWALLVDEGVWTKWYGKNIPY